MDIRITTLSFICGISAAIYLAWLPSLPIIFIACCLPAVLWRYPSLRYAACFLFGLLYCVFRANIQISGSLPEQLEAKWLTVSGVIISLPQQKSYGSRFLFQLDREVIIEGYRLHKNSILQLSWRDPLEPLQPQQGWQLQVRVKRPHGYANPGGYDYQYASFQRAISARGYVKAGAANVLLDQRTAWSIDILRHRLSKTIAQRLNHQGLYALIIALVIGERASMTSEQWEVLQNTGTAHLMAISGLHIGLVYGLGFAVILFISRMLPVTQHQLRYRNWAMVSGLGVALLYAALAGFSIPTQRALIMLCCFVCLQIRRRKLAVSQVFAACLLMVLILDPFSLYSAGFWLSFIAVAIIIASTVYRQGNKPWYWQWGRAQWFISFLSMPLLWFLFASQSSTGLFANLVAIPVMSFVIVPLIFLALVTLSVSESLAGFMLMISNRLLEILWQYLQWLNDWPVVTLPLPSANFVVLILCLLGFAWVFAPRGIPAKSIALILCVPFFLRAPQRPDQQDFWLTVLDVGQGLAIVVQTRNHHLLYDTGARFSDDYDLGSVVVLPYLQYVDIHRLNKLIVSHTDTDHIGGLESILAKIPVDELLISTSESLPLDHKPCVAQSWNWDGVQFDILHPDPEQDISALNRNDQSCVLRISNQHHSVLLTGDITTRIERQLSRRYAEQLASDVLLVPHHGSKTSSSWGFLATVQPRLAIIACGYRNRFGFPKQAIIERYQRQRARILNTAESGAILIQSHDATLEVDSYRMSYRRIWHAVYDDELFGEN